MPSSYKSVFMCLSLAIFGAWVPSIAETPAAAASSYSSSVDPASAPAAAAGGAITIAQPVRTFRPFSTVAVGVSVSTLGIGAEVATPLAQRLNLRVQSHFFPYSGQFSTDGVTYNADLKLRSAIASVDWFPFHGSFHVSPGVQLYGGLKATANALVPAGQTFTLNDTDYTSSAADPIHGTGSVTARSVAPAFTFGWGNLVSRKEHGHFSVPVELGFIYQGAPKVNLAFAGVGCDSQNECGDMATEPEAQANLAAEQKKANDNAAKYGQFYPIISVGFGFKF